MLLLKKRSEEELLDLINSQNSLPVDLQPGDLVFGKLSVVEAQSGSVSLPTVAMLGSGYDGYATFSYNRIDLSQVFDDTMPIVSAVGQNTLHRLLPQLNKALGTNFFPEDIYDVDINWVSNGGQVNLEIRAKPDSLGYQGFFRVRYIRQRPPLSSSVVQKILGVHNHPLPIQEGKRSLAMLTWGIDFTNHLSELSYASSTKRWRYNDRVMALMSGYGFAGWPSVSTGNVFSYKTSAVPNANQSFHNVYIHKNVSGADYKGDAFFHYNPK